MIHLPPTRPMLMKRAAIVVTPPTSIGTPVDLGHNQSTSINVMPVSLLAPVAAGNAIGLFAASGSISTQLASVADDALNTWNVQVGDASSNGISFAWATNAAPLNAAQAITATFAGAAAVRHGVTAFTVAGLLASPTEALPSPTSGTAITTSIASGAIGAAHDILFVCLNTGGNAPGTVTVTIPAGWTAIGGTTATNFLKVFYKIVSVGETVQVDWTNSVVFRARLIGLKGTA